MPTRLGLCVMLFGAVMADAAEPSFLKDYAETNGFMNGRPTAVKFAPDGKACYFLRSGPRDRIQELFRYDFEKKSAERLLGGSDLSGAAEEKLSAEEKARRERQRQSGKGIGSYHLVGDKSLLVPFGGKLYLVDVASRKAEALKTQPGPLLDPQVSPDGGRVGYVADHDLYCYDFAAGKETRLTSDGTLEKPNGLAEFVAQEEMARPHGYWWSPDGKEILFQKSDHAGVEQWHVADPLHPERAALPQYYPRPGQKNVKVSLSLVSADGSTKPRAVEGWDGGGDPVEYLANVKWTRPGGLFVLTQNRTQSHLRLVRLDPVRARRIGLVKDWHRHRHGWLDIPPGIVHWADDRGFWVLEDAGHDKVARIRMYAEQPSDFNFPVHEVPEDAGVPHSILRLDRERHSIVFTASHDPSQLQVWRYTYDPDKIKAEGRLERLSPADGVSSAVVPEHGRGGYTITTTDPGAMPLTTVYSTDGSRIGELPSVAQVPPSKPEVSFQFVGEGEQGYHTALVKPRDFDPMKRYPVVVHVYGGPKHLTVQRAMRPWLLDQWLADHGFVVVGIDNPGTPGRSIAWEQAVYAKFHSVPLEGQVAGLKLLGEKFPFLDMNRVGVHGWSFGGYMAARAVLARPDVFKAAAAGAPVTDWEDYDTHYTERYLGLLPELPEVYRAASLLPLAPKLERPLLLIHGTADDNVYFRHSLKLIDALFRAGKEFEVLPLPGLTHMVPDPVILERLWGRYAKFFKAHLGGPN